MFVLKVLGALSFESENGSLPPTASQKRRLGLLALLAVAGPRGLSRERVQAYMWPESSADRSRHALDQLLYATRSALDADPFLSSGRELRLDLAVVRSDVAEFEEAIRANSWLDAVAFYGGPLLDGFHLASGGDLETWIETERTRLRVDYQKALETLARTADAANDSANAVSWWRKLGMSDPLSSRTASKVIRALAKEGDRGAAIEYARAFSRLLRAELGVERDPAIEKLVADLTPRAGSVEPVLSNTGFRKSGHSSAPDPTPYQAEPVTEAASRETSNAPHTQISARAKSWGWAALVVVITGLAVASANTDKSRFVARAAPSRHNQRPADPDARMAYLRGLNAWSDRSKEGLDTAVIFFRRATEIDPAYAEAYAGLADAYVLLGYSGYRPADAMFPKAKASALRGIELDSTLAAPHAALAHELMWERDFATSEAEYRKAITLDPGYATAHQWYSMLLFMLGRIHEAVAESGRAASLDPLSLQIQNTYATFLGASGQPAAALRHYEQVVGEEPDAEWVRRNPWLLTNMATVYAANGLYDKAIRTAERALEVVPNHPRAVTALAAIYIQMGKPAMARKVFARADTANEHYAVYRGMMHARLGEADSAFLWFDRVEKWGIPMMMSLPNDGQLQPIRKDPRYATLLKRLGLLSAQSPTVAPR